MNQIALLFVLLKQCKRFYCIDKCSIVFLSVEKVCIPASMKFNNVKKIQQMNKILGTFVEDLEIEWLIFCSWFLEQDLEFKLRIDCATEPPESSSGPDILKDKSEK